MSPPAACSRAAGERPRAFGQLGADALAGFLAPGDPNHREIAGQQAAVKQAIDRRYELAAREVARCAEDHERERVWG